jgi:hypothetical protein
MNGKDPEALKYLNAMSILIAGEARRSELPADVLKYDESLDPWEALDRYITAFQFMMQFRAGKPGSLRIPFGQSPSESVDKQCDAWINTFLSARDRRLIVPPPWLLKWLAARAFAAGLCIEFEKEDGVPPPNVKNNMEGELKKRLVDMWHSRMKPLWPKIDPKKGDPKYKGKHTGGRF